MRNKAIILAVDDTPENLDVVKGVLGDVYTIRAAINGRIAFVLPYDQWLEMEDELKTNGLYLKRICKIKPKDYKNYHRVLIELVLDPSSLIEEKSSKAIKEFSVKVP